MNTVRLGGYAKLIRGITFKPSEKCAPDDEGAVVCMRTKNIQAELDVSDLIAVQHSIIKNPANPEKIISVGDILVSSANSWNLVGKCCVVRQLQYASTAGGFISILRPICDSLFANYLYRWFSSTQTQRIIRSFANQTTNISNLDHKRVMNLEIPLPPLPEQKRIAGILDAADALRAKRREAIAQLDALLQSVFLDMFGDPVSNPKGWEVVYINVIGDVVTGNTPPRKEEKYYGNSIQWIKSNNISKDSLFLSEAAEYLSEAGKGVGRVVPAGSILVTCIAGSPSSIGNAAIADREIAFNQQINAFVPGDRVNKWFFLGLLKTGKRVIQRASTNSMKGMVSKSAFNSITVPLPPLQLQTQFATIVQSIEQQKTTQRAHLAELDTLFAALQSRAFNGEL